MDNKYMKVLSHTEATEIKHGPAWLKPAACLGIAAVFYACHYLGDSIISYILMFAVMVGLMLVAFFAGANDQPEKYHVQFSGDTPLSVIQSLKQHWHICECEDGTAILTKKFPEEEEEYV